ncbi:hypothetical protein BCR33DRAFT_810643 [Rhizoclosmatium globosum]|uniref:Uncharacterized protein n=1 Tax=Rhizoclosmatium globosum TaxID=329046 RepID=A0A1Y2ALU0_9FUNG|nr:hypothetical protein BCR33DRAFT_810643 [Rhizoclosmatium globosum]|eukprot:ORY23466.1 hypothetical protein BCR33DRAFT_810643 [Rhizoclosmatium globosum]
MAADKGKTLGTWIKNRNKYVVLNMRGMKGWVPELREYQRLWDIGSIPRSQPTNNYHNPPTTNTAPGAMTIAKYKPRHRASGNNTQPQASKTTTNPNSNMETMLQTILARLQPLETLSTQATALANLTNTLSSKITHMESRLQHLDYHVETMASSNKRSCNNGYQSQDDMESCPHKKAASHSDQSNCANHEPIVVSSPNKCNNQDEEILDDANDELLNKPNKSSMDENAEGPVTKPRPPLRSMCDTPKTGRRESGSEMETTYSNKNKIFIDKPIPNYNKRGNARKEQRKLCKRGG